MNSLLVTGAEGLAFRTKTSRDLPDVQWHKSLTFTFSKEKKKNRTSFINHNHLVNLNWLCLIILIQIRSTHSLSNLIHYTFHLIKLLPNMEEWKFFPIVPLLFLIIISKLYKSSWFYTIFQYIAYFIRFFYLPNITFEHIKDRKIQLK